MKIRIQLLLFLILTDCTAFLRAEVEDTTKYALNQLFDIALVDCAGSTAFNNAIRTKLARVGNRDAVVAWVMNRSDAAGIGVSFRYTHQHLFVSVLDSANGRAFECEIQVAFDALQKPSAVNSGCREIPTQPHPDIVPDSVQKLPSQ